MPFTRKPLVTFFSALALTAALSAAASQACWAKSFTAKVTGISDGDSLTVVANSKKDTIRLLDIDAPELKQPYGPQAKALLTQLVQGKEVWIDYNAVDQNGRLLAEVTLPDGRSVNRELVARGMAWHFVKYSKSQFLTWLEKQARNRKLGLWREKAPVSPWEFRRIEWMKTTKQVFRGGLYFAFCGGDPFLPREFPERSGEAHAWGVPNRSSIEPFGIREFGAFVLCSETLGHESLQLA